MMHRHTAARVVRAVQAFTLVAMAAACAFTAGCGLDPSRSHKPDAKTPLPLTPPTPRTEGAIYQAGQQMELFADLKARRVGDVLTITLNESTAASKNAITKTAKTTSAVTTGPTLFGKSITTNGVPIFNTTLNGADSFDGEGQSSQSNSLAGALTVTVVDVQANGNLVVQGDKTLHLNQGDEFVHITGTLRPADIATNNTVTSDKLADANIRYSGKGVVDSSNRVGWLARFFNSPFAPF
jgi:flagellar L-ring protein precursor FlgH